MKKMIICLAVLVGSTFSLSYASLVELKEMECSIKPIDRAKIHPKGSYYTAQSTSTNWSGYVAAKNLSTPVNDSVNYVAGSWVVPTLKATTDTTYCAIWIGIDGYLNGTVEQIGTSHNWVNGMQQNYAWFEMYPSGSYEINGFPVDDGDLISAKVAYKGNNVFKLVITNHTKGVTSTVPTSYTTSSEALRSSAEWVVEAPFLSSILPLADFKKAAFNDCFATISGVSGTISNGNWANDEMTMQSATGMLEAQPSALLKNGSCFEVTWKSE